MPEVHHNIVGRVRKRLSADKMKAGEETLCQISEDGERHTTDNRKGGERNSLLVSDERELKSSVIFTEQITGIIKMGFL